jgi:hypothetical protein
VAGSSSGLTRKSKIGRKKRSSGLPLLPVVLFAHPTRQMSDQLLSDRSLTATNGA